MDSPGNKAELNKAEFSAAQNAAHTPEQADGIGVTADMYQKLDQMVEVEAATLETERLHLSPYYGEAYAEVVQSGGGAGFQLHFRVGAAASAA